VGFLDRRSSPVETTTDPSATSGFATSESGRVDPGVTAQKRNPDLVPCVRCGAQNGRSASVCWNCEGALAGPPELQRFASTIDVPRPPPEPDNPAPPAAESPLGSRPARFESPHDGAGRPSDFAAQHLPVLTAEVPFGRPALLPPPARRPGASSLGTLLAGVALLGLGGWWLFAPPGQLPSTVAPKAASSEPVDTAVPTPPESGTEPPPEAPVDIEPQKALALPPGAGMVTPSPPAPRLAATASDTLKPAAPRKHPVRDARHTAAATGTGSTRAPAAHEPPLACTATVAALGLCTARPNTAKE
jgi:hypothetical protein